MAYYRNKQNLWFVCLHNLSCTAVAWSCMLWNTVVYCRHVKRQTKEDVIAVYVCRHMHTHDQTISHYFTLFQLCWRIETKHMIRCPFGSLLDSFPFQAWLEAKQGSSRHLWVSLRHFLLLVMPWPQQNLSDAVWGKKPRPVGTGCIDRPTQTPGSTRATRQGAEQMKNNPRPILKWNQQSNIEQSPADHPQLKIMSPNTSVSIIIIIILLILILIIIIIIIGICTKSH